MNIYVDVYLAKNFGDDLFLCLLANHFKNIQFTVNFYGKEYDSFLHSFNNVIRPRYPLIFKLLNRLHIYNYIEDAARVSKKYDAILFLGGSIFREESYWKQLYSKRMAFARAFREKQKPVIVMGANFGPYQSDLFFKKYRAFFELCNDVCFRDKWSYHLFQELNNVRYGSDIVFQAPEKITAELRKHVILYSVIDPSHIPTLHGKRKHYIDWIAQSIEYSVKRGFQCQLISFCESEGDLSICRDVFARVPKDCHNYVEIVNYTGNIDEIIKMVSASEAIVASRFHANVIGLLTGTKVLPLIYSDKTMHLLNDINFTGDIVKIEHCEQCHIATTMNKLLEEPQAFDSIDTLVQSSLAHFTYLDLLVRKK